MGTKKLQSMSMSFKSNLFYQLFFKKALSHFSLTDRQALVKHIQFQIVLKELSLNFSNLPKTNASFTCLSSKYMVVRYQIF
jgi:hypothetical protein